MLHLGAALSTRIGIGVSGRGRGHVDGSCGPEQIERKPGILDMAITAEK